MPILNVELSDYDALRERCRQLEKDNERLRGERDHICDDNKVRVIEKTRYLYDDDNVIYDGLANFDDVKREVEEHYKNTLEDLTESRDAALDTIATLGKKVAQLSGEIERLKTRNLWERIWNK